MHILLMLHIRRVVRCFTMCALALGITACTCPIRTIQVFRINEATIGTGQGVAYLFINSGFIRLVAVDGTPLPEPDRFGDQLATAYELSPGLHSIKTEFAAASSSAVGLNTVTTSWKAAGVMTSMSAEPGHIYSVNYDQEAFQKKNVYLPAIGDCGVRQLPTKVVAQCALNDYMPICDRLGL
jgi:hypothetical protein